MTIQMSEKPETPNQTSSEQEPEPGNLADMRLTICHVNSVNQ